MKKNAQAGLVGFAIVIVIALVVAGLLFGMELNNPLASVAGGGDGELDIQCSSEVTPDFNIKTYDAENPGTAINADGIYRKVGDVTWSALTTNTAETGLEVGQTYEYYIGITSSDFLDEEYGPSGEFTVPCEEASSEEFAIYNDEVETSLTATFYNRNHDASAEAFTAGEVNNIYLEFVAGNDEVFGNPFLPDDTPNVLCMDLNSTTWDKPVSVTVDGATMNQVSNPIRHDGATGHSTYCYEVPVVDDAGYEIKIRMDADDTNAPDIDETAYLYAGHWFVNSETGDVDFGIEDNEGNAVGTDSPDTLTLDFTA